MEVYVIAPNLFHGRLEEEKCAWGCGVKMVRRVETRYRHWMRLIYLYTWAEIDNDENEAIVYAGPYFIE